MKKQTVPLLILLIIPLLGCIATPATLPSPSPNPTSSPDPTVLPTTTPSPTNTIEPTASFMPTASETAVYLSNLPPHTDPENIEGGLQIDRVYWQQDIWINGVQYAKGLGMHAPLSGVGRVQYRVPQSYRIFIALIGLARQDDSPGCNEQGSARFRVLINNEIVFETDVIRSGQTENISVPVQEKDILTLEVDNAGDTYTCDHSTWAEARFER